jgi:hypothetical protein
MPVPLISSTRTSGAEGHTLASADLPDGQVTDCAPEVTQYLGGGGEIGPHRLPDLAPV